MRFGGVPLVGPESQGFVFHSPDGEPYWDETAYYQFNLHQIENDLEAPTEELHQMTMDMVGDITRSEEMLTEMTAEIEDAFADGSTINDMAVWPAIEATE